MHIQNSPIQNSPIQNSPKNHVIGEKQSATKQSDLRSPEGALRARRHFAATTGPKFRIKSYPLLASSQHAGATAAVTILFIMFVEQRTIFGLTCHISEELEDTQWTRFNAVSDFSIKNELARQFNQNFR